MYLGTHVIHLCPGTYDLQQEPHNREEVDLRHMAFQEWSLNREGVDLGHMAVGHMKSLKVIQLPPRQLGQESIRQEYISVLRQS